MDLFPSLVLFLSLLLLLSPSTTAATSSGPIHRTTDQQALASISPGADANSQPFLTSPSGNYIAYLIRDHDSCYVQVQEASTGRSAWESGCAPVASDDPCALVFSEAGLGVMDGSQAVWDTAAGGGASNPETLEMTDDGGVRITGEDGVLVWTSSDEDGDKQGCSAAAAGSLAPVEAPVAPPFGQSGQINGLAPAAATPFASPVGGSGNVPFGQSGQSNGVAPAVATPFASPVGGSGNLPFGQSGQSNGVAPAVATPFASPAGGSGNLPFGQSGESNGLAPATVAFGGQQLHPREGLNGGTGIGGQPLVDSTPFDSGDSMEVMGCSMRLGFVLFGVLYGLVF